MPNNLNEINRKNNAAVKSVQKKLPHRCFYHMWRVRDDKSQQLIGFIEAFHEYAGMNRNGEFDIDLFEYHRLTITFYQTKSSWKEAWHKLRILMPGVEYLDESILGDDPSKLP